MSDVIIKELFNAPIDIVWAALTEVSKMKEWYFDVPEFRATKTQRGYNHFAEFGA